MAQPAKALTWLLAKAGVLSLIPRTHMVEREERLQQVVLQVPHVHASMHMINKCKKKAETAYTPWVYETHFAS